MEVPEQDRKVVRGDHSVDNGMATAKCSQSGSEEEPSSSPWIAKGNADNIRTPMMGPYWINGE